MNTKHRKLNRENYGGWTAFNSAAESGSSIFQILLEEPGININKGDCNGDTPLLNAVEKKKDHCTSNVTCKKGS